MSKILQFVFLLALVISPDANAVLRAVAGSGGGGSGGGTGVNCTNTGGVVYNSANLLTCNSSFTTDGAGAVSASASVTAPAFTGATVSMTGAITSGAQVNAVTLRASSLTLNRVPYVCAGGVLCDSSGLTFDGTSVLTLPFSAAPSVNFGSGGFGIYGTSGGNQPIIIRSNAGNVWGVAFGTNGTTQTGTLGFATSVTTAATADVGISRIAAGVIAIGNGTASDTTGSIKGVTTNSNAPALSIGEMMTASVASSGATVSLVSGTAVTAVSSGATVTAGDWDVDGVVCYITQVNTSITLLSEGVSTTNNTFGSLGSYASDQMAAMVPLATAADEICRAVPTTRVSLSGTSTVYLVTKARFTVGTLSSYGFMRLRRMR